MYSTTQEPPGWDGGTDAEQRLEAALVQVGTVLTDVLAAPMLSLRAERLGRLFELHGADEAMMSALKLAMVARAEACDVGKTTGAVTTAAWLRTAQRMGRKDAGAAVTLARDLDRTVTLTARALARGELSFRHAQVIAFAIKDLPDYIGPDQLAEAEDYLIEESRRRNPAGVRVLGRHLLQVLVPQEWERRLGEQLAKDERAAERKRSLCFMANGIPGSETVVIKLPVLEMGALRKIIEALVASDTRPDPDERPLDQKRGDAFAELVARMAEWEASPNRGRGRDCVTVLIGLQQLMTGTGFGTIDDLNPVRPMPCRCQTPDAKRQDARRKARQQNTRANDTTAVKPKKPARSNSTDSTGDSKPKTSARSEDTDDCERGAGAGGVAGTTDSEEVSAECTVDTREVQPDKEKPPGDPGGVAERIPGPREPGRHPQPNTETGSDPRPEADPEAAIEPEDSSLGEEDDAETEEGAAGPEAATDHIDPHDGCSKCGGGSALILGLRGEPLSVATIRRMACDANIIPVVLGGNGEILDVGMADRFFTEPQRRALAVRDGSHCHFPGCQVPERRCVAHHMTAWDDFGPTDLANGVLLCKSHHTFMHHRGWQVRMGAHGHPEYIPPEWVDPNQRVCRP